MTAYPRGMTEQWRSDPAKLGGYRLLYNGATRVAAIPPLSRSRRQCWGYVRISYLRGAKAGCRVVWYTIYLDYVRSQPAPQPDPRSTAAGYQHKLPRPRLCRVEAGDPRDGHLRPRERDPARRAAALRRAGGEPHADPRGDDPARAGGLCPDAPAPRHLRCAQDQARDRRNDTGQGAAGN